MAQDLYMFDEASFLNRQMAADDEAEARDGKGQQLAWRP